jgi:hypothetical protein
MKFFWPRGSLMSVGGLRQRAVFGQALTVERQSCPLLVAFQGLLVNCVIPIGIVTVDKTVDRTRFQWFRSVSKAVEFEVTSAKCGVRCCHEITTLPTCHKPDLG